MTRCKGPDCGAEIGWALTVPGGKRMPIDPESSGAADGQAIVWCQRGVALCVIVAADKPLPPAVDAAVTRYRTHYQTCPDAPAYSGQSRRKAKADAAPG